MGLSNGVKWGYQMGLSNGVKWGVQWGEMGLSNGVKWSANPKSHLEKGGRKKRVDMAPFLETRVLGPGWGVE